MNADPASQLRLLDLQALDSRLDLLANRRRTLPELAQLDALATRLAGLRDDLVRAETEVRDLDREQRRIEADVDQVRSRMTRDQQRLDNGSATPREMESLQSEIGSLTRRRDDLEDQVLEVMERRESADAVAGGLRAGQEAGDAERAETMARRDAAYADLTAEETVAKEQRGPVVADIPADLLALYEKLRAGHEGVGAAALHQGRCQGCHLDLPGQDLGRLRAAPPEQVMRCEECSRILVRTPESGL